MLRKVLYVTVSTMLLTLAGVVQTYAQEAAMMDVETIDSESDRLREKTMYSPGESSSVKYSPSDKSPKDSLTHSSQASASKTTNAAQATTHAQQVKMKTEKPVAGKSTASQQKQVKNDDESILSFNFLYYIIEKYKLQDIVD